MWVVRSYLNGVSPVAAIFGPRPERRLAIVEQAAVDSRRRLVLLRRDNVEHLIMTGGPVDVVIETGISERRAARGTAERRSRAQSPGVQPPAAKPRHGNDAAE